MLLLPAQPGRSRPHWGDVRRGGFDGCQPAGCNDQAQCARESQKASLPLRQPPPLPAPRLTELDSIFNKAAKAKISFRVSKCPDEEGIEVQFTTYSHRGGSHLAHLYFADSNDKLAGTAIHTTGFSQGVSASRASVRPYHVRFETVDVSSTKSPKSGKELRNLVMQGIAEAFGQEMPAEDVLAAATKAYRDAPARARGRASASAAQRPRPPRRKRKKRRRSKSPRRSRKPWAR